MATEIEAKISVPDLGVIAERLRKMGAEAGRSGLERNLVFDRPDESLMRAGTLLRVRSFGGEEGVLTVKRPLAGGRFKTREEVETRVDSAEVLSRQLQAVGFTIKWIYEKRRAVWHWGGDEVALDECPEIGCFVEIEGTPDSIAVTAEKLGLDPGRHIEDSYLGLWQKHLAARGETLRHMVFQQG